MQQNSPLKVLGTFSLTMISIAAIINIRGLPLMASMGLSSVFFYITAALFFLIPSGLVCAELATTYPEAGGVYLWVKKAFGDNTGFIAIWLEWINNVISFPASLATLAATLAFLVNPALVQNKSYIFITTLIILWGATFFNMLGIRASSRLNIIGALFGTLIPGAVILLLGAYWLSHDHATQITFSWSNVVPAFHMSNFVFFAGVISGYAGMQITAFHAPNVINPQKNFSHAILLAVILILLVTILGSLSIAFVVPHGQLSLVAGLMQGYSQFFQALHMTWAVPILVVLIAIGCVSTLSAWLMGPARGLAVAAKNGHFFRIFSKENTAGAPVAILLLQACIASIFATLFLYLPNANTAFWMLLDMSSQSTILMYILLFSSVIALRFRDRNITRPFQIPFGNIGLFITTLPAILVCIAALMTSFSLPTSLASAHDLKYYQVILMGCTIIYLIIPLIVSRIVLQKQKV